MTFLVGTFRMAPVSSAPLQLFIWNVVLLKGARKAQQSVRSLWLGKLSADGVAGGTEVVVAVAGGHGVDERGSPSFPIRSLRWKPEWNNQMLVQGLLDLTSPTEQSIEVKILRMSNFDSSLRGLQKSICFMTWNFKRYLDLVWTEKNRKLSRSNSVAYSSLSIQL